MCVCEWMNADSSKKHFECSVRVGKCYKSTSPFTIYTPICFIVCFQQNKEAVYFRYSNFIVCNIAWIIYALWLGREKKRKGCWHTCVPTSSTKPTWLCFTWMALVKMLAETLAWTGQRMRSQVTTKRRKWQKKIFFSIVWLLSSIHVQEHKLKSQNSANTHKSNPHYQLFHIFDTIHITLLLQHEGVALENTS